MPIYKLIDTFGDATHVRADRFQDALGAIEDVDDWDDECLPIRIEFVPYEQKISVNYGGWGGPPMIFEGAVWDEDTGLLSATAGDWDEHYEGQRLSICSHRWGNY